MITTTQTQTSDLKAEYNLGYVWLISIVAAMGGLLFGYDWVVIGGAKLFFEAHFNLPAIAQSLSQSWLGQFSLLRFLGLGTVAGVSGFANSCALLGCLVGALVAGALSDRFGRKRLLITSAFLFAITSIGNALAPNFTIFVAWRILGGVGIGLASNLSPMYIAEIAPAQMRGKLVSINQLTIVIGVLLAQVVNWALVYNLPKLATQEFIQNSWYGQSAWRWMFGLTAIPSVLFFIGMFLVPESPRWLAKNGKREPARAILRNIGGESYSTAALTDIEATLANEIEKVNFRELLQPKLFRILLLGVGLAVFQQWCGINVIFNYAQEIFQLAGYDISDVLKNIAWTGSVNMAFTFVALGMVDRVGRRPLMLFGSAGLAAVYAVLALCYHQHRHGFPMLLLVLAAIAVYSMSLAPVVWVVISEIFPNRIRGAAMAVAVAALWLACFVLTYSFPTLIATLGPAGSFSLFTGVCVLGFFFILFALPETKNKTLEQIERELVD